MWRAPRGAARRFRRGRGPRGDHLLRDGQARRGLARPGDRRAVPHGGDRPAHRSVRRERRIPLLRFRRSALRPTLAVAPRGAARREWLRAARHPRRALMRLVSLVPAATEIACALGAADDLVAVTHDDDHPPEVRRLPRVTPTSSPPDATGPQIEDRKSVV